MICQHCKETRHTLCRGRIWCDCQHRDPLVQLVTEGQHLNEASLQEAALTELVQAMDEKYRDRLVSQDDGPELRQPEGVQDTPVPGPEQPA